jgi:hypothetical protein
MVFSTLLLMNLGSLERINRELKLCNENFF